LAIISSPAMPPGPICCGGRVRHLNARRFAKCVPPGRMLRAKWPRGAFRREFVHLAIKLCRCLNIPARYCTGYRDIDVPSDAAPIHILSFFLWGRADRGRPRRIDRPCLRSRHGYDSCAAYPTAPNNPLTYWNCCAFKGNRTSVSALREWAFNPSPS
jgi:hypothetical protein